MHNGCKDVISTSRSTKLESSARGVNEVKWLVRSTNLVSNVRCSMEARSCTSVNEQPDFTPGISAAAEASAGTPGGEAASVWAQDD